MCEIESAAGRGVKFVIAHRYCRCITEKIAWTAPSLYTVSVKMSDRPSRLFIDWLCKGRGTTAVGAWSRQASLAIRLPLPSLGITWAGVAPDAYSIGIPPWDAAREPAGYLSTARLLN